MPDQQYTVTISNIFDASSPQDAIMQMVTYLQDNAHCAGYRVDWANDHSAFIDAEVLIRTRSEF